MKVTFESLCKWLDKLPTDAPVRFAEDGGDWQEDLYFYAVENGTVFLSRQERDRVTVNGFGSYLVLQDGEAPVQFEVMGTGDVLEVQECFPNGKSFHVILKAGE